jgi:hypothetical protein
LRWNKMSVISIWGETRAPVCKTSLPEIPAKFLCYSRWYWYHQRHLGHKSYSRRTIS